MDARDCITMSPFITGFRQAVDLAVEKCLDNVTKNLKEVLAENCSLPETEIGDPLENLSNDNREAVLLLYGVSGSGKTRSIKRLLHKHWGHYFLPGNPSLKPQRNSDSLYDPLREDHSEDSCLLWKLIENINDILPGMDKDSLHGMDKNSLSRMKGHNIAIGRWINCLLKSRYLVFNKFLAIADSDTKTPANWLRFQTHRSTSDTFKTIFGLLLLSRGGFNMADMTHVKELLKEQPFFYCLDEAQCYLDFRDPNSMDKVRNLLSPVLAQILAWNTSVFSSGKSEAFRDRRCVVSGTSLKLKETASTIEGTVQISSSNLEVHSTICTTVTDFPLLTSGHQLEGLMRENGLYAKIKEYSNFDEILYLIKSYGIRLQGRYLWSVRYLEHLNRHKDKLHSSAISTSAEFAIMEAKESLKKRLSRLRSEKYDAILQELCWVVIQSDLLDRPTIFEKDEDHQMITEAFAVVETQGESLKGTLKEYLAMDAAREWFRNESKDMYFGKFKEYLGFSTNDAGSFGKAAEWFLALVSIELHRWQDC